MRSKFFSNTVDTGARGEEESGVVDYDAVRLAERESQKEAESRAVDVKLGQLAYKVGLAIFAVCRGGLYRRFRCFVGLHFRSF